jgi:hypothetical protein
MPEEDAFCVFVKMLENYKLREVYKPLMAELGVCLYQLEKLIEEMYPNLYKHFLSLVSSSHMFVCRLLCKNSPEGGGVGRGW